MTMHVPVWLSCVFIWMVWGHVELLTASFMCICHLGRLLVGPPPGVVVYICVCPHVTWTQAMWVSRQYVLGSGHT